MAHVLQKLKSIEEKIQNLTANKQMLSLTSFKKHNLVVLWQIYKTRNKFSKLYNLLHFVRQFLCRFNPQLFIALD